jgi:hypothetical protein
MTVTTAYKLMYIYKWRMNSNKDKIFCVGIHLIPLSYSIGTFEIQNTFSALNHVHNKYTHPY